MDMTPPKSAPQPPLVFGSDHANHLDEFASAVATSAIAPQKLEERFLLAALIVRLKVGGIIIIANNRVLSRV
jgi:hypothetical protein